MTVKEGLEYGTVVKKVYLVSMVENALVAKIVVALVYANII